MALRTPIFICILALIVSQVGPLFKILNFFAKVDGDVNCRLLGDSLLANSEDLSIYKWGKVFVSSGNLKYMVAHAPAIPDGDILKANIEAGRIGIVHVDENGDSCVQLLAMDNMPKDLAFHPHGIFYSNSSKRLYTITHGLANGGSGVAVFNVIEQFEDTSDGCFGDESKQVRLQFIRFITSPLFQNIGPNDLIEGLLTESTSEIYLTKWLQFPGNMEGKAHPKGMKEILHSVAQELIMLDVPQNFVWFSSKFYKLIGLEFSGDSVFRCVWENRCMGADCVSCQPVVKGLVAANGITVTPDRKKVFVNDLPHQKVYEYNRQADGSLLETSSINLPYLADNIEYDVGSGDIYVGSIPTPFVSLRAMKGEPVYAGGGLVVLHQEANGNWTPSQPVFHDGSKLSQISSAVKHGSKVIMGSPISRGVLECQLEN